MRELHEIIVHCTDTMEGYEYPIEEIKRWHTEGNGWRDIGYHFVIHLNGVISPGRPIGEIGAHCSGHNEGTIGICYVGGKSKDGLPKDTRTYEQRNALIYLIKTLLRTYPTIRRVSGHCDYSNKACPCFNAKGEYKEVVNEERKKLNK